MSKLFSETMPSFGVLNNINRCPILIKITNSRYILTRIIELIELDDKSDGRSIKVSYAFIGKMIGLSEDQVKDAIAKMSDAKIIIKKKGQTASKITLSDFCLARYWRSYIDFYKNDIQTGENSPSGTGENSPSALGEIYPPNKDISNKDNQKKINKRKVKTQIETVQPEQVQSQVNHDANPFIDLPSTNWEAIEFAKLLYVNQETKKLNSRLPKASSNFKACEDTGKYYSIHDLNDVWPTESRQIHISRKLKLPYVNFKAEHKDISIQQFKGTLSDDNRDLVVDICTGGKHKLQIVGNDETQLEQLAVGIFKQNLFEVHYPNQAQFGAPRIAFLSLKELFELRYDDYQRNKGGTLSTIKDDFGKMDIIIITDFNPPSASSKFKDRMMQQFDDLVSSFDGSIVIFSKPDQNQKLFTKIEI
jgi:hypothetical protein